MKIDIRKITEGEESITIRYREPNPTVDRVMAALEGEEIKIWGRTDDETVSVNLSEILYLESVDDRVFACTGDKTLRIEGTLYSFMNSVGDDSFFRCSKSMVINVNKVKGLKSLSSNRIDATMESGEHIIISRRFASEFRRFLRGDTE